MSLFRGADNNPSETYEYFSNELQLAYDCIGKGITTMSYLNYHNKNQLNSMLFMLSIGFERILKLIVILDYYNVNGTLPDNIQLKNIGHDIESLFEKVREIGIRYNVSDEDLKDTVTDVVKKNMISIISDFAKKSRYYNLDSITGITNANPLHEWNNKVYDEIVRRHQADWKLNLPNDKFFELLDSIAVIHYSDWDNTPIETSRDMIIKSQINGRVVKYSRFYIFGIVRAITTLFRNMESVNPEFSDIAFFSDIYAIFYNTNRKMIMNTKTWDIYNP